METTLTRSVLMAVSMLAAVISSQGGHALASGASPGVATVGTHAGPILSEPKARVCGNGRCVALGSDGNLWCAADGVAWSPAFLPGETFLRGVAFGNGRFVAVGGSYVSGGPVILTSMDGRSWNRHRCPSRQVLHGVAYFGGRFIAVGDHGTILTSESGRCWQKQLSGTEATLAAIACGNGLCVIGGDDGLMLSSGDTLSWARRMSGTHSYISKVAFDREHFVATAGDLHFSSNDGSRWRVIASATVPREGSLTQANRAGPRPSLSD